VTRAGLVLVLTLLAAGCETAMPVDEAKRVTASFSGTAFVPSPRTIDYAGARAVLVPHWPVETTSARALTTDLFRRQVEDPGLSRAKALQRTMNALIDGDGYVDPVTKRRVFSYAHPLFWAPFVLVGDGGS
jgi:CHAT domain-containing protein